ncbi:sigma 54-interacting transcriptional regulator [Aneurinibacillus aneurinilyticus]|uniref:sigma-54 interaction domain-containing protein n=1 Tax=Aneurinibacillus aneurinilyticus TaxID=1391 RepID=UPI002E1B4BE1|nr:sigma 54-interacting transcriptional regulator [Aneurinibacillus aneurinilyticus]MED0668908.1 sigma 54-interacting transcriptional regulator [Aneurinibacillus aneurinilyticus]
MVISKEWDTLLDLISDGIIITDHEGTILKVNKAYERIVSIKPKALVGKNIKEMVKDGTIPESSTLKVLQTKQEVTLFHENNEKDLLYTGTPMFNERNEIVAVVNCVRDMRELNELKRTVTQIKQVNQEYREQLDYFHGRESKIDGLIAESREMQHVLTLATKVAPLDSVVMLRGESGVGKEVIAKFIHTHSKRVSEAFIKVNCGAIPKDLMESEFFGYETGAFTGASKGGKPGFFELADKGTLFLDEIGDMPQELQVKLLRVLEDREFRRIGGVKTIHSDVRIIAATNQPLEELVEQKKFRKDLYYRLQVYPIVIPPLRERTTDIPHLIEYYLNTFQERHGTPTRISPEAIYILSQYKWPGNIREVINLLERLVIICSNREILPEHLPREITDCLHSIKPVHFKEQLEWIEFQELQRALKQHGSTRKASESLQMSKTTFIRKLKKYEGRFKMDHK